MNGTAIFPWAMLYSKEHEEFLVLQDFHLLIETTVYPTAPAGWASWASASNAATQVNAQVNAKWSCTHAQLVCDVQQIDQIAVGATFEILAMNPNGNSVRLFSCVVMKMACPSEDGSMAFIEGRALPDAEGRVGEFFHDDAQPACPASMAPGNWTTTDGGATYHCVGHQLPDEKGAAVQLRLGNIENHPDGSLIIGVIAGGAAWPINVVRSKDGDYSCGSPQCSWAKRAAACEHVQFAIQQYDAVISQSEEAKRERERQVTLAKLEEARALVVLLEQKVPTEPPVLSLNSKRNIELEE